MFINISYNYPRSDNTHSTHMPSVILPIYTLLKQWFIRITDGVHHLKYSCLLTTFTLMHTFIERFNILELNKPCYSLFRIIILGLPYSTSNDYTIGKYFYYFIMTPDRMQVDSVPYLRNKAHDLID